MLEHEVFLRMFNLSKFTLCRLFKSNFNIFAIIR